MTQSAAAKVLGVQQPHVSLLMRNRAGTFSVGRLMEFLTALGHDVEVTVRPTRRGTRGNVRQSWLTPGVSKRPDLLDDYILYRLVKEEEAGLSNFVTFSQSCERAYLRW